MKNENEPDSWDEWGSPEIVISDKENSTALPPLALNNIVLICQLKFLSNYVHIKQQLCHKVISQKILF